MCRRQIQHIDRVNLPGHMPGLSFLHILGCSERTVDQLYVQQRLHGAGWHGMCGVYRRYIQGREWIVTMLAVLTGQVLDKDGRDLRGDVHRLSRTHVFWGRQQLAGELHVQQRLHRRRWSRVHGVRWRGLQGHERLSRLHAMFTRQVLCCGGGHCCLHLRRLCSRQVLSSKRFDRLQQLYRWHVLVGGWCRVLGLSGIGNFSSGKWQRG